MNFFFEIILLTAINVALAMPLQIPVPAQAAKIEAIFDAPDVGTIGGANGTGVGGSDDGEE